MGRVLVLILNGSCNLWVVYLYSYSMGRVTYGSCTCTHTQCIQILRVHLSTFSIYAVKINLFVVNKNETFLKYFSVFLFF